MDYIIDQTINILTTSPGNLFYHLILIFSIVMTIQAFFALKRWIPVSDSRRIIFGLLILLVIQIALFLLNALIWQGLLINGRLFFPPIDRAVLSLSFLWIIWMWCFNKPSKIADIAFLLLNIGLITLVVFTIRAWSVQEATIFFNSTILDWSWLVFTTVVLVSGILLILVQRPKGWGPALVFFNINLIASLAHMLWASPNSDFSAAFRFTQIISFPLLPGIVYRFHKQRKSATQVKEADMPDMQPSDFIWVEIIKKFTPSEFIPAISTLIALKTGSIFCLFQENGDKKDQISIIAGFDTLKSKNIPSFSLEIENYRAIGKALGKHRTTNIVKNALTQEEFTNLSERLEINVEIDQLFIYPVVYSDNSIGSYILAIGNKDEKWASASSIYLDNINKVVINKFQQFEENRNLNGRSEALERELDAARHQLTRKQLEIDHHIEQQKDLPSLIAIQEDAQKRIDELTNENKLLSGNLQDTLQNQDLTGIKEEQNGVEIIKIIDRVIDDISLHLLERNINLQLELPQDSPVINFRTDLLEKALIHLFLYASEISQESGLLTFTLTDKPEEQALISLSVERLNQQSLINKNLIFCEAFVSAIGGNLNIVESSRNILTMKIVLSK